jgi:phage shock protein PspC (stress-responsive transcriptional regulator)
METTETIRAPRRLARPREGRWLGGVAAGLGEYFDLSPVIYRVAFVALALAGGTGILLYVAAWLVIPDAREDSSVAERMLRDHAERPARAIGLALIAFFGILALSEARWWPTPGNLWLAFALAVAAFVWWEASPRGAAARHGEAGEPAARRRRQSVLAILTGAILAGAGVVALLDATGVWNVDWRIVLGALVLVVGAIVAAGAAAGLRVGGIAGIGIVLFATLALVLAVRVPIFAGWGDHIVRPASASGLASRYELGIGYLRVDLSDVALPVGETHMKATLGIGDLVVRVPPSATVEVDGRAGVGNVRLFGREVSGTSVHEHVADLGSKPARVLVLDSRVGIGQVEVVRG